MKKAPGCSFAFYFSAGIGRTGTFIALDTAYNQAKIEGAVRIFDVVTTIREQRVKMIQTRVRSIIGFSLLSTKFNDPVKYFLKRFG